MKEFRNKNVKSVFGGIGVAALLCVLMVLMSWSAMVTNSDINSVDNDIEAITLDEPVANDLDAEVKTNERYDPTELGFEESNELVGMRTETSKTYLKDGGMFEVHSMKPLHYKAANGQFVELDTTVKSSEFGYYVHDIYTPVSFSDDVNQGFVMQVPGNQFIHSGMNLEPVIIKQVENPQLPGVRGIAPSTTVESVSPEYFALVNDGTEVGGNSLSYPLTELIDLQYHVSENLIKQEFVIEGFTPMLDEMLSSYDASLEAKFGFKEIVELPENAEVWTGNFKLSDTGELVQYDGMISIIDPITGQEIAFITAPLAYDNSHLEKEQSPEDKAPSESGATYYLLLEEGSSTLEIITAVNADWLVDDNTIFPVVIDPSIGSNTELSDTTAGSYYSCDIAAVDCFTETDGHFEYDYSSYGGYHQHSPRFDFTFTQGTSLSVGQVVAYYEIGSTQYVASSDRAGLIVMEDCGATVEPDGDTNNLNSFANPSGCGGVTDANGVTSSYTPLPFYTTPPPPPGAPVTYYFSAGTSNFNSGVLYDCDTTYYTGGIDTTYDVTSDMTSCYGTTYDFIYPNYGSDESGGIFVGQTYDFTVHDTYGDGIDNGQIIFQTRTAGSSGAWTDALIVGRGQSGPAAFTSGSSYSSQINVASTDEMRLVYHCEVGGWNSGESACWGEETYATVVRGTATPTLPAVTAGTTPGSPTGSEAASTTFTIASGQEAVFEYTVGTQAGDADETEIYWRLAGTTGWTNVWDLCDASTNAANCVGGQTYLSSAATPPIVIQNPGTYEVLVWDTFGDGSGTPGNTPIGGQVIIQSTGTGGVTYVSPSGQRLVSLISSEQVAQLPLGSTSGTPRSVVVCSTVASCESGPMSMFNEAYQNGGYIEFGLGWMNAVNGLVGANGGYYDATAYFENFFLVVDLEDTTPDTSIPTVTNGAHYDGVTSYVEGDRTLYLSLTDVENGILYLPNGATYEGPQLHYTTDGNTYQTVDSTMASATCMKNTICTFSATTDGLSAGDTVGYYWTFSDAAQNDNTKIPAQTPNPGRFPAAGANDLTFTIADKYNAPQTTSAKITTLLEDLTTADITPSSVYTTRQYDRQMTYYTETGEFHVEFDFSECGNTWTSIYDVQAQCMWDGDYYSAGDQALGHWDINWEGTAGNCYPGATGCTGAPTNTLELDSHFGGMLDISKFGTDNLVFSYDATANAWAVAGAGTGIANRLTSAMPDVTALSYTANVITPPSPITITEIADGGVSSKGPYTVTPTFTVPSGEVGRIEFDCRSWCSEVGMTIIDVTTPTAPIVYNVGNTNGATEQSAYNSASYVTSQSSSGFGSGSSTGVWYTDNLGSINSNLPTLIPAGDYEYYEWDDYGDGTSSTVTLETVSASTGFAGVTAVPPYDATSYQSSTSYYSSSNAYTGEAFIIDFAATGMPTLANNDGFGGVPFGTNAGEFNQMCVSTSGLVIFMEGTGDHCIPDVDESSAGGSWQGFALGASVTSEDYGNDGLLWQYRDVQPDPDTTAPQIDGGIVGDSHALQRTITAIISDNGVSDTGINTSPVPGVGPTVYATITAEDGTVSNVVLPMTIDSGDQNSCVLDACSWSAEIDNLARGDSVTYYITANDMYPPGANSVQSSDYTFGVGNPTNTLVVEWHEYSGSTSTYYLYSPCSFQVIMYDVTNEFEYHYDEDCATYYDVGVVGHRESPTNYLEYFNPRSNGGGFYDNPLPDKNLRFTYLAASNTYAVETFDRDAALSSLVGLSGSQQAVQASSGTFGADVDCDSNTDFNNHAQWCAGNFDIPNDFNFEFYGNSYDGSDSNNRIHALSTGMMHFIDNGDTSRIRAQGSTSSSCWASSGVSCLMSTTSSNWPSEPLMAPYWSRETIDYCYTSGGRTCEGVWYRTMPFDGQGKIVSGDIVDDTTWYLIDSPIKVNPTSADGYLSVMADLTIEAGVEVIIGENKGISFDGGLQQDGTCAKLTAMGTASERVTFDADRTTNPAALWHGLAFTDKCGIAGEEDRHMFEMVDFSNTNHAAITAGSRPADPNGPSCGDAQNDCDVGEFTMTDVTFTNVDSAFSHGSGQGTVVTMSNFAVTDARSACFNFAENTIATLTGTALNPSTMTRCNNDRVHWGGAVVNQPGSTGGELTMSNINIVDSYVSLIRVDLQKVYLNDISATNTNDEKQASEAHSADQAWSDTNGGVNLALSYGTNGEAVITNFDAQNYHHGWICATSVVQLNNVNLGAEWVSGFTPDAARSQPTPGDQYFDIDPTCGAITNAQGATGVNAVFDDVTAPSMTMYRTFPGTANMITTSEDLKLAEFPAGTYTSGIEVTQATIGGDFIVDGCNADITLSDSSVGLINSICSAFQGTSALIVLDSSITHDDTFGSAIFVEQATATLVNVDMTSTTATATGPYFIYAGYDSTVFAIDVNVDSMPCADINGKTAECLTGKDSTGFGSTLPELYFGGFAEVNAYRLGLGDSQILEPGVTIVASTLDSTGAELFPGKTIYSTITDSSGSADKVAVVTGDDDGVTYDTHHIRASGAAGAGEAHPQLADGTPATEVQFINGVLQTAVPLPTFGTYTIGSVADVRLLSPPVTFDDSNMDCAWMSGGTNATFANAYDAAEDAFIFKGATMVLADNMDLDGCTMKLIGSKMVFRDSILNPSLTISAGGNLIMEIDTDTGDLPKIFGEGNLDAVDIVLGSQGTLDMQAGTIKNFRLAGKSAQMTVPTGANLNLAGGAYLTSSDLTTVGADYPMIHADGGIVTVSSAATLAGASGLGIGVVLTNSGELNGDGLTVSNMKTGIDSLGGSLDMDSFTSTGNKYGLVAEDGPKLPQMYRSATLQGMLDPIPFQPANAGNYPAGFDNCIDLSSFNIPFFTSLSPSDTHCVEWTQYTVDLSSWIGETDYLQPAMQLNYDGHSRKAQQGWTGWYIANYVYAMNIDNMQVLITDNTGAQYVIDDATDPGYYPWGTGDSVAGANYQGGLGGLPNWDCNEYAETWNPYTYGVDFNPGANWNTYSSLQSGYNYPDDFGFRITEGDDSPGYSTSRPKWQWGYYDQYSSIIGPGLSYYTNPGMYHDTPIGQTGTAFSQVCGLNAYDSQNGAFDSNMILEWPTLDLTDPSIAKVELQFDFLHDYEGAYFQQRFGVNNNQDADGLEMLARSGDDPAAFGDFSNEIIGKGISLTNSDIDDAEIGVDFRGNLIGNLQNVNFDDPVIYAVRTSGTNDLTLDGLNVVDAAAGSNNNYGFYTETVSSGAQSVTNSNFNGVGTAIYLTNDVDTTISNTAIINSDTGITIGSSSSADHIFDTVTLTNNNLGIAAGGFGTIKMNDVDVTSLGDDLEITGGNTISFLDGTIDQNKVSFSSSSIGTLDRDRSFVAVIAADGNPVAGAAVGFSSRAIGESSTGYTDSNGQTSGLKFSVYDLDVNGVTDYSADLNSYSLSTVAEVAYSWTSETVNDGDFRYIQSVYPDINPQDSATDSATSVNYASLSLVDTINARVCSSDPTDTVVSPCAGTLSSSGSRVYSNGMVEYDSNEGLQDGSTTMDLSNSAVMIDAGNFELRDGVELILDNSVVFATGYNDFTIAHNAWISDVPYGAQITMDGGEISGSYPLQSNGQSVGLLIGGYWGSTENALNLDINNVVFNNVAGIATGTGDRTFSSAPFGSLDTYIPSTVEITNSYFNHYRGFFFAPTSIGAVDMCLRFSGVDGAIVSGNTFSDCTIGVAFMPSQITTTNTHELIGSDNMVIDGNIFDGASSHNIWAYAESDVDMLTLSNNVMSCSTCTHVYFWDDSSLAPTITGNTFTGGDAGVSTITTEFVNINNNIFNNQEDYAIVANGGDFSIDGNIINNPGEYGIYANSLEKPSEVVEQVIAGINSPQPDNTVNFASWTTGCGSWWTGYTFPCLSPDVTAVLGQGEEMVIRMICGSYCYELTVNYKDPSGNLGVWDAGGAEGSSNNHGSPNIVFTAPGSYIFNLEDSYGDGPSGGGFEIMKSQAGAYSAGANPNPVEYWIPYTGGLTTTKPTSCYNVNGGWPCGYASSTWYDKAYSNTADSVLIQNNGADSVYYDIRAGDMNGDGIDYSGNLRVMVDPVGTYQVRTTTWASSGINTDDRGGPFGTVVAAFSDTGSCYGVAAANCDSDFGTGEFSKTVQVEVPAGYEMRFRHYFQGYGGEQFLAIQEAFVDNSWVGPSITNNVINFDSVDNNPLAVGMYLSNCDVQDYAITTDSNTINIGQNAVWNDGCIWNDKDSVITGSNQAGSVGYDDDNTLGADIILDGTTISGFETGVYKTTGGAMEITGDAQITAGAGGYGILADGIDVTVTGATFDGGATGTGMKISNSAYSWLYPMDVTGNVGLHAVNSEILWDGGAVDADTILIAETVTGTVQSLTDPASGGAGLASASSTTMIDARTDTRLTTIDWSLDETKLLVDSTSIIEESNWLDIDANHLGAEPTSAVGVSIISDQNSDAYSSPVFENNMLIDGSSDDWFGGNELNPSGYAMPGNVGGPMYVTVDAGDLVIGLDGVSTATSDVYIYIDSNDFAGTNTGFNGVHTLPYAADYAIVADSTGSSVYFYNSPTWSLNPTSNIVSAEDTMLEIRVPLSSISGSSIENLNFVALVQNQGTNDVTTAVPTQTTVGTGAETFTEAYDMELNKLDLSDGVLNREVLLYRSFTFSNVPSAGHTYQVMVKTAAEARHTCDYDWATQSAVTMDMSQSLTFDILRACPEITTSLADVQVLEDSGAVTFDLATYVDDEQDVEANMKWSVEESNMDAYDNILTNFNDMVDATGTFDLTPINDQFGTFELTFEVVDSHGQTAEKTILYEVLNINDAPVICDARIDVDPDCNTGDVYLYSDPNGQRFNSRDEGFTSYSKPLGDVANDSVNSFIRDMANEQFPVNQDYTWNAAADCDQMSIVLDDNANGVPTLTILENQNWEEGGICDITLDLADDGRENNDASSVVIPFAVAPINDVPVIANSGQVTSTDLSNSFTGELNGDYRVTLVEDTTDSNALTFDLSSIKSDIDHLDADLTWTLEDTNTCTSSNYYSHSIVGDTLSFTLFADATTNAEPWEVDMLNNNGIHQTRTANGYCEMTLTLSDSAQPPSYMPNYTALSPNNYVQESTSVTLSIKVDNVVENVPDYFLDGAEGFDFNGVNNIMPGTWVPVDFSINAGGDEGPYTYNHLLKVSLQTDGHTEVQLPRLYTPPAYGTSLDIDDWEVYITDQTTEVWVEVDVVTCNPGQVCTPASNSIQTDSPESHNAVSGNQVFGKWSEPGRMGESADGTQSNRRPAFEDKNWCNNLMTSNAAGTSVAWSDAAQCGHTEQGYSGQFVEDWQTGGNALPVRVTTIGALSVASFAPSIIAVALTGMFVSALVFAGRRDDDEEDFMEETMSDDESAVSPVIATILMVAITVVLSGVVYVWAAQLADTDTKGVPVVTFSADNVDTANTDTDHWKITIGQAQTVLATQAVEVTVSYINGLGEPESQTINLASTNQVYGFSPYNSDSLVTFGDVLTIDGDEKISTFSTGDDIYVKTHLADGTPLVDATIRIVYNPPGDTQGATLKTYSGMNWNQPV